MAKDNLGLPEDREEEFLYALGLSIKQLKKMPEFFVRTKGGKVRLIFRTKLEPLIKYGDWALITVSEDDFINMCRNMNAILDDLNKNARKKQV